MFGAHCPGGLVFYLVAYHDVVILTRLFAVKQRNRFLKHNQLKACEMTYDHSRARLFLLFVLDLVWVVTTRAYKHRLACATAPKGHGAKAISLGQTCALGVLLCLVDYIILGAFSIHCHVVVVFACALVRRPEAQISRSHFIATEK